MLTSRVCKFLDFQEAWYSDQEAKIQIRNIYAAHSAAACNFVNRKFWEWCAISQTLEERAKLQSGMSGMGFAVGTEPLSSYFASNGCKIIATDLEVSASEQGWITTNQHAASRDALYQPSILPRSMFEELVSFQSADMRRLGGIPGEKDFLWSSCALEHLGSLDAGIEFIRNSARLLKKGGVAVHTTEFNVLSNDETVEAGPSVIYRRKDIEHLKAALQKEGFHLCEPDYDCGNHPVDVDFDVPPYMQGSKPHVKLQMDGHVATSMLLIIEA